MIISVKLYPPEGTTNDEVLDMAGELVYQLEAIGYEEPDVFGNLQDPTIVVVVETDDMMAAVAAVADIRTALHAAGAATSDEGGWPTARVPAPSGPMTTLAAQFGEGEARAACGLAS